MIPDRSALAATLVVVPIFGVATWCALRVKPQTTEAKIAVASLVAPALLVVARQVLFYEVSMAFWGVVLGACALAVFGLGLVTLTAWLEHRARQTSPLGGG